jgi:uncharacterized PurR-regulated membrane protein YhhQ (DUF165 family)
MAFLVGSFLNAYVMSRMKLQDRERRFAWRAILSTIVGEGADSLIFFPAAFGGLMPVEELGKLMLLQVTAKTLYEVVAMPVTVRVVRFIKQYEQTSAYDKEISYNVFKIMEV